MLLPPTTATMAIKDTESVRKVEVLLDALPSLASLNDLNLGQVLTFADKLNFVLVSRPSLAFSLLANHRIGPLYWLRPWEPSTSRALSALLPACQGDR